MLFGERLAIVRKSKKISQDELAKAIGAHAPVIGRYERGEVKPSIEVATKIANVVGVSLDYLVGNSELELDNDILNRVVEIQQLPEEDKKHILYTLDGLLQNVRTKKAFTS